MEWITVLFSWVWFDAALLFFAMAVCAALLVSQRAPRVTSGPSLQRLSTPLLEEIGDELHILGFKYHQTLQYEREKGKRAVLAMYLSSERLELAYVAAPQHKDGGPVFELLSIFEPFGSVLSTNSAHGFALSRRGPPTPGKLVARVPWKSHVEEIIELHRELCATAEECGLFRVSLPDEALDFVMQGEFERGYEIQVERGTMRRSENGSYRLTFKGVLLIPWRWATRIVHHFFGKRHCGDQQQRERVESEVQRCLKVPTSVRSRWPERIWMQDQVD